MLLLHTLMAVIVTGLAGLAGYWVEGAVLSSAYFLGREIAQAEYRWIERHGKGLRANMKLRDIWATPGIWDTKSWFWDLTLPIAASTGLAYLYA